MKDVVTKKGLAERSLTGEEWRQLRGLANRAINTEDIPEALEANWATAERGRFFKPRKEAISLRLDADLLDWLRCRGPGYQTMVNRVLRDWMNRETSAPAERTDQVFPFTKRGIDQVPDDKPCVYMIVTETGRMNYVGLSQLGAVRKRLMELHGAKHSVPGAFVRLKQYASVAEARKAELEALKRNPPKYDSKGSIISLPIRHRA
jgi:uncharacterized protein (DUF4415 family)